MSVVGAQRLLQYLAEGLRLDDVSLTTLPGLALEKLEMQFNGEVIFASGYQARTLCWLAVSWHHS